jgi:hypothetical protein
MSVACLVPTGCLPDLTKPGELDGGAVGDGGANGDGPTDAATGPRCDPGQAFSDPVLLTTTPGSINTGVEEGWPRVSRDDRTLYFVRAATRDGGRLLGGEVLYMTREASEDLFDEESVTAESTFISGNNNDAPVLSPDGTRLYYSNGSDRIFVSVRDDTGPFPYPGGAIEFTDEDRDLHPYLVGDDTIYFASSRGSDIDDLQLFRSVRTGGNFAVPVAMFIEASSPGQQLAPVVSSDKRVVFFSADGTIYRAVREEGGTFGTAVPADDLNGGITYTGSLSRDDCVLYMHSDREDGEDFDIWMAEATALLEE